MSFVFRRAMRSKALLVMLLLLLTVPPLAAACREASGLPTAGYVCPDGPAALHSYLEANGFTRYVDAGELRRDVQSGKLDLGAVFTENLEALLIGGFEGEIELIQSPTSLMPELWRAHLAAAVYAMRAPYIGAEALEGTGIAAEQALERYASMLSEGFLFDFKMEFVDGGAPEPTGARSMAVLALGMLVFLAELFAVCLPAQGDLELMRWRIGGKKALKYLLWPQLALRSALVFTFALAGAWLSGFPELWIALLCQTVCCACLGAALLHLIKAGGWLWCVAVFACAGALPLLPVYFDAALILPAMRIIRYFDPVCWLWLFDGNTTAGAISAALACALCYTIYKVGFTFGGKI